MIIQAFEYYPFGMAYNEYSREDLKKQDYLFNGKESQSELGLDWYDFGARMYEPETARWNVMDPVADKAPAWTPFRFAFNNPLRYVDPDGKFEQQPELYQPYPRLSDRLTRFKDEFKAKPQEFKESFYEHSTMDKYQTLKALEDRQGPKITTNKRQTWYNMGKDNARFYGPDIIVINQDVAAQAESLGSSDEAEARKLLIESVLLEQLVRYGVSQSWTGKKEDLQQAQDKAADDFLEKAYGGKVTRENMTKVYQDMKKREEAKGADAGPKPDQSAAEKTKKMP